MGRKGRDEKKETAIVEEEYIQTSRDMSWVRRKKDMKDQKWKDLEKEGYKLTKKRKSRMRKNKKILEGWRKKKINGLMEIHKKKEAHKNNWEEYGE